MIYKKNWTELTLSTSPPTSPTAASQNRVTYSVLQLRGRKETSSQKNKKVIKLLSKNCSGLKSWMMKRSPFWKWAGLQCICRVFFQLHKREQVRLSWTVILVAEVKWSILGMCAAVKSLPQSAAWPRSTRPACRLSCFCSTLTQFSSPTVKVVSRCTTAGILQFQSDKTQ